MISCDGGRCAVQGPLTIDNAAAILEESHPLFAGGVVSVDLGQVTEVDSSAIGLLLEWRRGAERLQRKIEFINLPENLKSLAALYGVSEFITGNP
jgi:phospholipid transport system transporter-binding protein